MKILQLKAENVKKLGVVEITPEGNVIVVGGNNGAGKSSVLDSIWFAIGGKGASQSSPIHHGKDEAEVFVTIGSDDAQLHVKRTWNDKGSTLKVKTGKGVPMKSPQSVLDSLYGSLTFDPLAFSHMSGPDQVDTLKQLTGLDLEEIEGQRAAAYEERTDVGRELRQVEANLKATPHHPDVSDEETSIAQLLEQRHDAQRAIDAIVGIERAMGEEMTTKRQLAEDLEEARAAEARIVQALSSNAGAIQQLEEKLSHLAEPDLEQYDERIRNAEAIGQKQRENAARQDLVARRDQVQDKHSSLTSRIAELDLEKCDSIERAEMPVEGLAFGDGVVLYQTVPLDQCSSAERLRVSVSIGIAMNPKLKVLLIRDGSLLDEHNLEMIASMAEKADAQVWIERVGDGAECSIIMEDGAVREEVAV